MKEAEIHTSKGIMKLKFYEEDAPKNVANFIKLADSGFYDGLTFHRVIPNFVIQGGCPDGTGAGGPGYYVDCELDGKTSIMTEAYFLWHMQEEIPVVRNFLFVTTGKAPSI
jgi:cyclophilin family peptidyl-prolyl cis-trans isomerase